MTYSTISVKDDQVTAIGQVRFLRRLRTGKDIKNSPLIGEMIKTQIKSELDLCKKEGIEIPPHILEQLKIILKSKE